MDKAKQVEKLEGLVSSLKQLQKTISASGEFISKKEIREEAKSISLDWFENIESTLTLLNLDKNMIAIYHEKFDKLLRLTLTNSRKKSYLECIASVLEKFNDLILIPVMKFTSEIKDITQLEKILENVNEKEQEYLREAIGCATHNFNRASVVLAWSAGVYRMHKLIEKLGFDEFNKKTVEMKSIGTGRYKRFTKSFEIHNLAELQTVFDSDLLWVLEYWNIIDSNQHDRLAICFTMRNNSGHPGEANISPENLLSFYSDLKTMVFDNPKFKV